MKMPAESLRLQKPVLAYASLLRRVHALIAAGQGDSPEAEQLADLMDAPWAAMQPEERKRVEGLSEDLYTLYEGGASPAKLSQDGIRQWKETAKTVLLDLNESRADAALEFLRRPFPEDVPAHAMAFFQSRCWQLLGDVETALVFMREAERLDPAYTTHVLILLQSSNDSAAQFDAAVAIASRKTAKMEELYLAGALIARLSLSLKGGGRDRLLKNAIVALAQASKAHRDPTIGRLIPDLPAKIAYAHGVCLEGLGKYQ